MPGGRPKGSSDRKARKPGRWSEATRARQGQKQQQKQQQELRRSGQCLLASNGTVERTQCQIGSNGAVDRTQATINPPLATDADLTSRAGTSESDAAPPPPTPQQATEQPQQARAEQTAEEGGEEGELRDGQRDNDLNPEPDLVDYDGDDDLPGASAAWPTADVHESEIDEEEGLRCADAQDGVSTCATSAPSARG